MTHALDQRYSVEGHIKTRRVDDELVILDLRRGQYCGLDDVGARLIELMGAGVATPRDALPTLLTEFDVDAPRLEADITALIEQLCEAKIIAPTGVS